VGAKACILCGATPPPPLTGEHIWPDWYNRQQPNFRYELESVFNGKTQVRPTQAMNLKPTVLCRPCNNDWGAQLEDRVAPILTPMMRGKSRELNASDTQLISAWLTLKVMTSEYLLPAGERDRRFFELSDGEHLKATLRPPDLTHIWIGRYVGSRVSAGWITDRSSTRQVSDDPPAGIFWHSVVYTIGQVLLHLFASSRPIPLGDVQEGHLRYHIPVAPADWDTALIEIWPTPSVAVSWPPKKAFDDDAAVYLVERWNVQQSPGAESPSDPPEPPDVGGA